MSDITKPLYDEIHEAEDRINTLRTQIRKIRSECDHDYEYKGGYEYYIHVCRKCGDIDLR